MFVIGDELGAIKILCQDNSAPEAKSNLRIVRPGSSRNASVQVLSARATMVMCLLTNTLSKLTVQEVQLAAGYSNGTTELFTISEDDTIKSLQQWTESRLKNGQRYIGLHCSEKSVSFFNFFNLTIAQPSYEYRHVFSCTSNGALSMRPVEQESLDSPTFLNTSLPTRLCDWRLSDSLDTFAYGGDEVDISVWNTERAFRNPPADITTSKRKRNNTLFEAEIWRAKNAPNDHLGLRQPIRTTTLSYLFSSSEHLLAGTQLGSVRRYDTRAARKPVSDWKIAKTGGIEALAQGFNQHDSGSNLFSLDLRNGRISYSYKGLAGAVTSIAPSPAHMVSVARDRYCRIHSTFPPPHQPGQRQEHKGEVMERIFTKSMPTVVVWNGDRSSGDPAAVIHSHVDDNEDEIWDNMEDVEDEVQSKTKKRRKN
ncbi:hypothetical protein GYMLUDRAFT_245061 [Collybiopsis luxurians FD-317 M1]|uniref:Ribosome biogenesis protein NSA1 n=1 Tax=Collybiopsis luxurians FD-317 M1 TaxID=944289 RepID=A0A0D0CBJ5_9AGAR|nr:hypothetical protein GYMLUDRAFT_245061 [Collybiopsis luxurians FD-317 M1]